MKVLLLLSSLCLLSACASTRTIAVPVCPKPAPLPVELLAPAPPPGIFRTCLREILLYGEGQGQISRTCSSFLQSARTR